MSKSKICSSLQPLTIALSQVFNDADIIYIPSADRVGPRWTRLTECVWKGPAWLKSQQRLNVEAYKDLELLFTRSCLQLRDACESDVLNDLRAIKEHHGGNAPAADVEAIYDWLSHQYLANKGSEGGETTKQDLL